MRSGGGVVEDLLFLRRRKPDALGICFAPSTMLILAVGLPKVKVLEGIA